MTDAKHLSSAMGYRVRSLARALYTWAYEREVGSWGLNLSDRLLRFVGMSVIFHTVAAPATYELYRKYVHTGDLAHGRALPMWLWGIALLYTAIPLAAGWTVGMAAHQRKPWTRIFVGPAFFVFVRPTFA